jgi:hypothetical protein
MYYDATKSYSDKFSVVLNYTKDISVVSLSVLNTGGTTTTYSISPALPTGLTLDSSTGRITGTPTIITDYSKYTITATNSLGSSEASIVMKFNKNNHAVWAATFMSSTVVNMEPDNLGNYYITGTSNNASATDLNGDGSVMLPSGLVVYLIKYNSVGVALWCKTFSVTTPTVIRVMVDSLDNSYICGFFKSSTAINLNGDGSVMLPATAGSGAQFGVFLIKYNISGTAVWAKTLSTSNGTSVNAADMDANDNVYFCGRLWAASNTTLENSVVIAATGGNITYLIKYNSSGIPQRYRNYGTTVVTVNSIAVDSLDNVYLGGNYKGSTNFNLNTAGTVFIPPSVNSTLEDGFVAKLDSTFEGLWVKSVKGQGTKIDVVSKILIDSYNNVLATGYYTATSTLDLNDDGSVTLPVVLAGGQDPFLIKYNSSGLALWAKSIYTTNNSDLINYIALDSEDNIYMVGRFNNNSATAPLTIAGDSIATTAGQDALVVTYDSSGVEKNYKIIRGTGDDTIRAITVDNNKNFVVYGTYLSSAVVNLNGDNSITLPPSGSNRTFIIKFGDNEFTDIALPAVTNISEIISEFNLSEVCIGSTLKLSVITNPSNSTVTWSTSDVSLATVSSDGIVSGVALGSVTITATMGSYSVTKTIDVIDTREITTTTIPFGQAPYGQFTAYLSNAPSTTYWFSSDPTIIAPNAIINSGQRVFTCIGYGTATICVLANKKLYSKVIVVHETDPGPGEGGPTEISASTTTLNGIGAGLDVYLSNADPDTTWSLSNGVASITNIIDPGHIFIETNSLGTFVVTAVSAGVTYELTITVV